MTDALTFHRNVVSASATLMNAIEQCQLLQDRLLAESGLSAAAAAAASASGRTDLQAADFDNFKLAMTQLLSFLDAVNAGVPTGGTLRLAFYKMM